MPIARRGSLSSTAEIGRRGHGNAFGNWWECHYDAYEYQCDACGGVFEALRSDIRSPSAGYAKRRASAKRHRPAFRLKGRGGETDFKKGGKRNLAGGESSGSGNSSGSSSGSGDSGGGKTDAPKASSGGDS